MPKRKHVTLSLQQKAEIILNKSGDSARALAEKYGVGKSTINDIYKNKLKILQYVTSTDSDKRRKTLKRAAYPEMEEELYNWLLEERAKGTPLSNNAICEKAKFFNRQANPDFQASCGWLQKFKDRFGIKDWTLHEEPPTSNLDTIETDKLLLTIRQMDLQLDQIYNVDESYLFYRLLPNQNITMVHEEFVKESITFMPCINATANHKLRLLVLGKTKEPKAFANSFGPVCYRVHEQGWIDEDIFRDWFHTEFVPSVRQRLTSLNLPPKALLIMDNLRGYPEDLVSDDDMIRVMYMPPNSTSPIQHAVQAIKVFYKKNLLQTIVDSDNDIHTTLKGIHLKDVIYSLSQAWQLISDEPIKNAWTNLLSETKQEPLDEDDHIPRELRMVLEEIKILCNKIHKHLPLNGEEIEEWALCTNEAEIFLTDEVTVEEVLDDVKECNSNDESVYLNAVSHIEAVTCFDTCIKWALENDVPSDQVFLLHELRGKAIEAAMDSKQ